jgi:streptogramin lyase
VLEDRTVPHTGVALYSTGLTANAGLTGIVQGPDNNRWFTEFAADKIGRIITAGQTGVAPGTNAPSTIAEFNLPTAGSGPLNITVGPDGNLWFTENTGDRIGRINPLAGDDAAIQASLMEFSVPNNGGILSGPNYITTGPDGALWFTESTSDEIGRITTAGAVTNEFAVPGAGSTPSGIATGADGKLWFTEAGSGQIGNITTGGTVTEFTIPVPNAGAFSDPEDIVLGPNGNLFFTDFGRDQIGRITPAGVFTQFNLPVGRGPNHIVAFNDGDLYFTEAASSRIGRLPSSALAEGAPQSPGAQTPGTSPGASTLVPLEEFDFVPRDSVPLGITISETGDIWFTLNNGNALANFFAHLQQLTATATGPMVQEVDVHFNPVRSFQAFDGYNGNLSLSVTDMNRNGVPDAIVGTASPGSPPAIKIFDGSDNRVLASFDAFDPGYLGGITLTTEDVNADGYTDIIVADTNGRIKVIDGTKIGTIPTLFGPAVLQPNGEIADSALLSSFSAYGPGFSGGVNLAAGDINVDGNNDIVVAPASGGSRIKVIDGRKIGQVQADGMIAPSALLGDFLAYDPSFTGGAFVAVNKNVIRRDIIVGPASGAQRVLEIDGNKLGQVQANGVITDSAILASFFPFGPSFTGGVRVAADDLNFDGLAEVIVAAGPSPAPSVKVVDGTKLGLLEVDGTIANSALLVNTTVGTDPAFSGGVFVASDADHRDGTIFGPPGVNPTNSQRDINDMFIFQSPVTATNTVLAMDVSPFSTANTPAAFVPGVLYDFRISNRDLVNATDDLAFRVTFGPQDPAAGFRQDVSVRALPAARLPGVGGVIVKGFTGQNTPIRGVGGNGTAMFRAAEQDDPFFFDSPAFSKFLNGSGLSDGTTANNAAGAYPSGTSNGGAGNAGAFGFNAAQTPDYNGVNFFSNANTLTITFEIPSAVLAGLPVGAALTPDANPVGFWGRTEANGVQFDRMGRPAINTALIPPVPRGSHFPADGSSLNRTDVRNAFNDGVPKDDRANFSADMTAVLKAVYPAGNPANAGQAELVTSLLLPDILVYDPTRSAGFFSDLVVQNGNLFLAGGRKFSDDIISTELFVLTDPDLPQFLTDNGTTPVPVGGPMPPLVVTQNVADDNGLNLKDGSLVGPGSALAGMQRAAVFPYIGDPTPPPVANLSVSQQGSEAGPTGIVFMVTLSRANNFGAPLTFDLTDAGTGTATPGSDYVPIPTGAKITVAPGATTGTFMVPVMDDSLLEGPETVVAKIANPNFLAVASGTITATAIIADNESPPPAPAPATTGAFLFNGRVVLLGPTGQPTVSFPVPPGTRVIFADANGDGHGDVFLFLPTGLIVLDGTTNHFLFGVFDVNGDKRPDILLFDSTTGALKTVFLSTGQVLHFGT